MCVVSNQVVDIIDEHHQGPAVKEPALGMAWAHCVNTRLFVYRAAEDPELGQERDGGLGLREIRLVWSPRVQAASCRLRIAAGGLQDVGEGMYGDCYSSY